MLGDNDAGSDTIKALAFRRLGDDSHTLGLINSYEWRYERQYFRAHRCFLEARASRTQRAVREANEAREEALALTESIK